MNEVADQPGWLTSLIQGGLPQLALGKHASTAIGRLIGAATDVPVAAIEGFASRIRSETAAREKVKGALATAAADQVIATPELVERAAQRWAQRELRKQENLEAVARHAVEDLRNDPSSDDVGPPSPDFMDRLEGLAESASSDEMRTLFGRILAGEIRKPGSYSLMTLHVLSVMDGELAGFVQLLKPLVSHQRLFTVGEFSEGPYQIATQRLNELGLLRTDLVVSDNFPVENSYLVATYAEFGVWLKGIGNSKFAFPIASLTPTGCQIFDLTQAEVSVDLVSRISNALLAEKLWGNRGVTGVAYGRFISNPNGQRTVADVVEFGTNPDHPE
jgi:hypothetical protein